MVAAACKIIREQPSGKVWVQHRDGDGIAGRGKRFGYALVSAAQAAIAGDLRNLEDGQMRLRMLAA